MTLEQLTESYTIPSRAIEVVKSANVALLVGISGAGKDSIKKQLLQMDGFGGVVSYTTRSLRENGGFPEVDGLDYNFIDEDKARDMLIAREFVEAKFVHGIFYGTSIDNLQSASGHGVALADIDVQGVSEYHAISEDVVAIFIVPPSYSEWLGRLKRRYSTEEEFLAEWPKRRESAIKELERALELPYYHCIVNDNLMDAVEATAEIARHQGVFTRRDDEAKLVARDLLQDIKTIDETF